MRTIEHQFLFLFFLRLNSILKKISPQIYFTPNIIFTVSLKILLSYRAIQMIKHDYKICNTKKSFPKPTTECATLSYKTSTHKQQAGVLSYPAVLLWQIFFHNSSFRKKIPYFSIFCFRQKNVAACLRV